MNILSFSLSRWLNDYAIGHILPLDCLLLRMHKYLIPHVSRLMAGESWPLKRNDFAVGCLVY